MLRVDGDRCCRHGRYLVSKLIIDHGGDAKLGEWLSKRTKDRPQKNQSGAARACDEIMPDLRGVREHLKDR